ncbi:MAG: PepSY-associated TM helix domain-containing protein [Woeseiaceae bacterium]|nr:PepSY-associated TM helix domain-containing protein [Woeseiaceae bacterium]
MTLRNLLKAHRWLAAAIGAFVLFQGITGAVSQQRFLLLAMSEPDFYAVDEVRGEPLAPFDVIEAVAEAEPDFRPAHVMYPMDTTPGTAVIVMGGRKPSGLDMSRSITVDQYSGALIGERGSSDGGWVGTMTGLHKWANYGATGRILLTIFGLGTAAFMISGLLLWRRSSTYAARMAPLRRWHRGAGAIVGAALVIVSLTGVTLNLLTWQERSAGNSVVAANMRAAMREPPPAEGVIGLERAWQTAIDTVGRQRLAAFSDAGSHAAQYWFAFTDGQLRRTDVLIDPVTGDATVYPSGLLRGGDGLRGWLYPVHTGYVFGWPGGLVMTLIGCSLIFWAISGTILWGRSVRSRRSGST